MQDLYFVAAGGVAGVLSLLDKYTSDRLRVPLKKNGQKDLIKFSFSVFLYVSFAAFMGYVAAIVGDAFLPKINRRKELIFIIAVFTATKGRKIYFMLSEELFNKIERKAKNE